MTEQKRREASLHYHLQQLAKCDAYDAITDSDTRFDVLSDLIVAFERAYPLKYGQAIADAIKEVLEDGGTEDEIRDAGYEIPEEELVP